MFHQSNGKVTGTIVYCARDDIVKIFIQWENYPQSLPAQVFLPKSSKKCLDSAEGQLYTPDIVHPGFEPQIGRWAHCSYGPHNLRTEP